MDLTKKHCVPCEGGVKPMDGSESQKYLKFAKGWKLDGKAISREMKLKDFNTAMKFVNKVGKIAESEGHHPDIYLYSWNKVRLTVYTHAIGGLSVNDFILAAKINRI